MTSPKRRRQVCVRSRADGYVVEFSARVRQITFSGFGGGADLDLHGIRVGTVQNEGLSGSVGSEIARRVALAVFADFGCFASIAVARPLNAQGQQSRAFRT